MGKSLIFLILNILSFCPVILEHKLSIDLDYEEPEEEEKKKENTH